MGQKALVEQFKDLIEVVRGESHLISIGLKQFVTEEQVIDFYEKVGEDKNLQLTWIKNFSRVIPDEAHEAKIKADEREIFDNYVVLHYDPMKKGKELTKEEKAIIWAKARDEHRERSLEAENNRFGIVPSAEYIYSRLFIEKCIEKNVTIGKK